MSANPLVAEYAARVGLDPAAIAEPTYATLSTIVRAHVLAVPFENLDLHLGKTPVPEPEPCWDKLVARRRGGWCHEHTRVIERVLSAIGFGVKVGTGQVHTPGGISPPGSHAFVLVTLEDPAVPGTNTFLIDVGFPLVVATAPLAVWDGPLDVAPEQKLAEGPVLTVCKAEDGTYARYVKDGDKWQQQWFWDGAAPGLNEHLLAQGCEWVCTGADSPFLKNTVISKPLPGGGRITLSGFNKIVTAPSGEKTKTPITPAEFVASLRSDFGVEGLEDMFEGERAETAPNPLEGAM